ncbi:3-dehydroquinate synthase [Minicystis rosea]|nr:3-dehydroquinate synthase [Minicystis rosea]
MARTLLLLSGFMGSGKSTVGRRAAERAGVPFTDLDDLVVARAGKPIPAIFASDGEPAFRRLEAEVLLGLLAAPEPRIVALGGGTLTDRSLRHRALETARVLTLTATPDTVLARTAGSTRPLLQAPDRLARIHDLLEARAAAYAEAHASIPTDTCSVEEVTDAVLSAWSAESLVVPLGDRSYQVRFVSSAPAEVAAAVAELRPSKVFLMADENVHRLWGVGLAGALAARGLSPHATVVIPSGEEHKRLGTVERALAAMVDAGADRDAVVLGHGGGVVTDMAGLAAALLLRGVRWVGIPTTLLAMVDASVGGKTGVDLGAAKNAVGAFHQPSGVIVDIAHVTTESDRAFRSGLGEVVKSAVIGDPSLFELLESHAAKIAAREPSLTQEIVRRSVAVKTAIVARDERESGDRALLNFGHTVGHALESQGGYTRLTHGESVALGMVAALRIGVALGVTDPALADRTTALLARLGLPVDLDAQPLRAALPLVSLDKKRRGGAIRFVLLRSLGEAILRPITPDALEHLLLG